MWQGRPQDAGQGASGAGADPAGMPAQSAAPACSSVGTCPGFSFADVFRREVQAFTHPNYLCISFVETQVPTTGKNQTLRVGSSALFVERDLCGVYTIYDIHSHYALWSNKDSPPDAPFTRTMCMDAAAVDTKQSQEWQTRLQWLRCMLRCSALKTDDSVRYALREMVQCADGGRAWAWCSTRLKVALGVTEVMMHSSDFPMGIMVRWNKGASRLDDSSVGRDWRLMAEPFFQSLDPAPAPAPVPVSVPMATSGRGGAILSAGLGVDMLKAGVAASLPFVWPAPAPAAAPSSRASGSNDEPMTTSSTTGSVELAGSPSSSGSRAASEDTADPSAGVSKRALKATRR